IPPGEIGVTLRETGFGECFHHLRPGERFGKKEHVRIFFADASYQVFPKWDRFGVRIIDPKYAHTPLRPEKDDADHLRPELGPLFAPKIQWKNGLVLLRRIFGIFNGAIRSLVKPIRMFLNVRMIGRAVDREIESDLHPAFPDFALK